MTKIIERVGALLEELRTAEQEAFDRWLRADDAVTDEVVATSFRGSEKLSKLEAEEKVAREDYYYKRGAAETMFKLWSELKYDKAWKVTA